MARASCVRGAILRGMGWPIHRPVGLTHLDVARAFRGYTLLTPAGGEFALLLDLQGRAVHRWDFEGCVGFNVELLPNGNLLALCADPPGTFPPRPQVGRFELTPPEPPDVYRWLGGGGSSLRELDWEGNELMVVENPGFHHDFTRLENGHTLILAWTPIDDEVARRVRGGQRVARRYTPDWMIGDEIIELDAEGREVERIELWRLLDPRRHRICPFERRWEWSHCNSIDVDAEGGILFSARSISLVGRVDRDEAGGASLGWEFGWPEISHQHHATAQPSGNVLIFDNGMHRTLDLSYSRVVEVNPANNEIAWSWQGEPREQFFSAHISGAARLGNGNTLVTEGASGRVFETTRRGEVVWEWISPFLTRQIGMNCSWLFRAWRYPESYAGLAGRELDPGRYAAFNRQYGLGE